MPGEAGFSLMGNGEPWKVLEEENNFMRPMLGRHLVHTCMAAGLRACLSP